MIPAKFLIVRLSLPLLLSIPNPDPLLVMVNPFPLIVTSLALIMMHVPLVTMFCVSVQVLPFVDAQVEHPVQSLHVPLSLLL